VACFFYIRNFSDSLIYFEAEEELFVVLLLLLLFPRLPFHTQELGSFTFSASFQANQDPHNTPFRALVSKLGGETPNPIRA
jgi:hypothetical protein